MGALSATEKNLSKAFYATIPGFMTVPFNDIEALEQVFAEQGHNIAAFIVELYREKAVSLKLVLAIWLQPGIFVLPTVLL